MKILLIFAVLLLASAAYAVDSDGVNDAIDQCLNTPAGCTVSGGQIDAATGCPTEPFTIEAVSDPEVYIDGVYMVDVDADPCLDADLKNTNVIVMLSTVDGVLCTDTGDSGYCDPVTAECFCPINVDKTEPGTYDVVADYTIGTDDYTVDVSSGVLVKAGLSSGLTSEFCKNALQNWNDPIPPTIVFSDDYEAIDGKYVVPEGVSLSMTGILPADPICSNQGPGPVNNQVDEPPVAVVIPPVPVPQLGIRLFVGLKDQSTGEYLCNINTGDGEFREETNHDDLMETEEGIIFDFLDTDDGDFYNGEAQLLDFVTIDRPGEFKLYIDHLNNVCRAPLTYLCPSKGPMYDTALPEGCNNKGVEPYKEVDIIVNAPPQLNQVPDQELLAGFQPYWTVDICDYLSDTDNTCGEGSDKDVDFSITSQSNPTLINCHILSHYFYCDEPAADATGTSIIALEAYDNVQRTIGTVTVNVQEKLEHEFNILLKWGEKPEEDLADLN